MKYKLAASSSGLQPKIPADKTP